MRTISDLPNLEGKKVLLRADFNVPMENGEITDEGRIVSSVPTIRYLLDSGASVIIISHLGRPEGKPDEKFSLAPVARRLEEILGQSIFFSEDTVGSEARGVSKALMPGGVALLENLRFNPAETSSDPVVRLEFAKKLAGLADLLVSDGFGVVHRKQASVFELATLLPSAAGLLIQKEVEVMHRLTADVERPYYVVLGGSKVSDKLGVIESLIGKVDGLLIGGGMAFTFLAALGHRVGASLLEEDQIPNVKNCFAKAKELGVEIFLPTDILMSEKFSADAAIETASVENLESTKFGAQGIGLDIGPETSKYFASLISKAKTVFWNGPMGVFEFQAFSGGTKAIAQALSDLEGLSVVGGGDSAAAVRSLGFEDTAFSHISTGGGASLEFLEGKLLPGLEVLND